MKFLDTTFLIDHQTGEPRVERYLTEHGKDTLVTSTLNLKEIAVGRFLIETPTPTQQEIRNDFKWLQVEPYAVSHALEAAEIEAGLRAAGEYRDGLAVDILIAGVAKHLGAPVVTDDLDDFGTFDGVETESY
jgi:predicted nucleic acid-binding protein